MNYEETIRSNLRQYLIDYIRIFHKHASEKELRNMANYVIVSIEDDDNLNNDADIWAEDMVDDNEK